MGIERRRMVGDRGFRHESSGEVRARDEKGGARVVERTSWRVMRDLWRLGTQFGKVLIFLPGDLLYSRWM